MQKSHYSWYLKLTSNAIFPFLTTSCHVYQCSAKCEELAGLKPVFSRPVTFNDGVFWFTGDFSFKGLKLLWKYNNCGDLNKFEIILYSIFWTLKMWKFYLPFSLFVKNLEIKLHSSADLGWQFGDIILILLLYADGMTILLLLLLLLGKKPEDVLHCLNVINRQKEKTCNTKRRLWHI